MSAEEHIDNFLEAFKCFSHEPIVRGSAEWEKQVIRVAYVFYYNKHDEEDMEWKVNQAYGIIKNQGLLPEWCHFAYNKLVDANAVAAKWRWYAIVVLQGDDDGVCFLYSIAMTKDQLTKKKLPDAPGVYFFLGERKEILYIGKATSLKNRVQSYFSDRITEMRSPMIAAMIENAKTVEWTETGSVLEALILETNLIRTHKPKYNTRAKDDKSYNHLVITNEEFPRVLVVRGKDLTENFTEAEIAEHFGPFPSGRSLREALKIVRKLFKFYDTKQPIGTEKSKMERGKIDFNRQIGLYPDVQSKEAYQQTIRHIALFFRGEKQQIIEELERDMMQYAKNEQFEEAEAVKRKIFSLKHIQDIALLKDDLRTHRDENTVRIEAYDVAHLSGKDMVGVMTVVEGGEANTNEYRKFKIKTVSGANDTAALKEMLSRRLGHEEWPMPQIIVVDGSTAQKNVAERILHDAGIAIPVAAVVKDERHRPVRVIAAKSIREAHENAILLANAESHRFAVNYHKNRRSARTFS